jgi:glycerol kinase
MNRYAEAELGVPTVVSEATASRPLVLAVDQGTTNTKALLCAPDGTVLGQGTAAVGIAFPAPGWVEQDAAEIWSSTCAAVAACSAAVPGAVPTAVAVSNQRESVVIWSARTGEPLGPVLGWQDARTAADTEALVAAGHAETVRELTGLSLDPMFSAPKMRWLLDSALRTGVDPADVRLGTVDAWLVHRLTGGAVFATDAGNAARTLLLDLQSRDWHPRLLEVFGIPRSALPEVRASDQGFGVTAAGGPLPAGIPVAAVLADSHAALYAHGCTRPGTGKVTFGTGSSVMTPCEKPDRAPAGITTTLAWVVDGHPTYAREGNILASGAALDWMAMALGAPEGAGRGAFLSDLAATVPDAGGVHLVPAFAGLGAPYWDRAATGLLTGITAGTSRGHLARAALEAVAHQVTDVVAAIEQGGGAWIDVLHADGGATASAPLMQLQADLLGRPVRVADVAEASALGVARLAHRRTAGPPGPPSAERPPGPEDGHDVRPVLDEQPRRARRHAWADAVARSRWRDTSPAAHHGPAPEEEDPR